MELEIGKRYHIKPGAVFADGFLKAEHTIKLFTPAPETTNVLGKTYLTTDVMCRMAELTPLGD